MKSNRIKIKSSVKFIIVASTLVLSGCASMTSWLEQPRNSAPAEVKVIPQKITQYRVQAGDTLYSIAKKFNRTERAIILWNNMDEPYVVHEGEMLQLYPPKESIGNGNVHQSPGDDTSDFNDYPIASTDPQAPKFMVTSQDNTIQTKVTDDSVRKAAHQSDQKTQVYVVRSGDTVLGVAYQHGMSLGQIVAENDLKSPYDISVGQQLQEFVKALDATPKLAPTKVTLSQWFC